MEQYIGTKLIEAEPATRGQAWARKSGLDEEVHATQIQEMGTEEGYRVRYPGDGYESWSPKDVFEKAYLPLTVNRKLKSDKPSVSQEMVDAFIAGYQVTTMGEKCTVVRAILKNGFEIVESSACVSKENYDVELGTKICKGKIKDKVWFLLGFLLQTAVGGVDGSAVGLFDRGEHHSMTLVSGECEGCEEPQKECECVSWPHTMSFGQAIEAMKEGMKVRRQGWNGKNQHIELASAISYKNPEGAVINTEHQAIGNKAVAFCGTSGVQMGWLASQADMLAEDWEIVF